MNSAEEKLYEIIDSLLRKPIVAEIGGFRPETGLRSWFGGNFWLPEGHDWPMSPSGPMIPVMQVVNEELPMIPDWLSGVAVFQLYIADELPVETGVNGTDFLVLLHESKGNLNPAQVPFEYSRPRPFQIRWTLGPEEGPSWDEVWQFAGNEILSDYVDQVPDCFGTYGDRYERHLGTKIGGWASYIQGISVLPGDYLLQIASEGKPQFFVGDSGNVYLYQSEDGEFHMEWDCY